MIKKRMLSSLALVVYIAVIICSAAGCTDNELPVETGDRIFDAVSQAVHEATEQTGVYSYAELYYSDGTAEYLMLFSDERKITGVRTDEGEVYYFDRNSWTVSEDGTLEMLGESDDPVTEILLPLMESLLSDNELTYTCHQARERDLPLWVYPDEFYILCNRPDFDDCIEVMVFHEETDLKYFRWNIARSADDAVLFVYADNDVHSIENAEQLNVFTWGPVEKAVCSALFSES